MKKSWFAERISCAGCTTFTAGSWLTRSKFSTERRAKRPSCVVMYGRSSGSSPYPHFRESMKRAVKGQFSTRVPSLGPLELISQNIRDTLTMALHIPRLNYQHLMYFWAVVRTGSLRQACEELKLSAPTVSAQLRTFEERIGEKLLTKAGRRLVPTETGRLVFTYAEEIFGLGSDLLNALAQRPTHRPLRLAVGVDDVVPKEIARRLLEGVLSLNHPVQLVCREGTLPHLLALLQVHELDVVISDAPATPSLNIRSHNHLLGSCAEAWMATPALASKLQGAFPKSLDGVPMLLPTDDTAIRSALDQWLDKHGVRPFVVGEFE